MNKLLSLAEKPATKEDIGKEIYTTKGTNIESLTIFNVYECRGIVSTYLYWQNPS